MYGIVDDHVYGYGKFKVNTVNVCNIYVSVLKYNVLA
jgi:hypothetical protein